MSAANDLRPIPDERSIADQDVVVDPPNDPPNDPPSDQPDEVLPWWHNPINLVALAVATALLFAAAGFVVGNNRALPDPTATDIGFLQDMRVHHEQAVQMSLIYLDLADTNRALQTTAREILVGQNIEIGRMIQLLRSFGESEINETDTAMSWMSEPMAGGGMPGMSEPVPLDEMPGLATDDDLRALRASSGAEADDLFVTLMTAHHQGGIQMAEYAAENAATSEVALMARQIVVAQNEEIVEMARLLARSTS